ncbi:hypothetical protein DSM104299_04444 [Baekduia alba]|uniref:hypothetical protein n=1 Tax=Baekduia alba TaxID=2997333 RepID=UPI002340E2DA|nr:hypothetical protein [Baekduia alba]WCB95695.1 hypothetical protein DSM104299_04444 [Baekduia alba]
MSDNKVTLRSYRLAFELERRLHRIDRFRIPVPYGIPLVALAYAAAVAVALVIAGSLPLAGALLGVLPWPVRLILLPGVITRALCHRRADGRPAHEAIIAYMMFLLGPRRLVGLERAPVRDVDLGVVAVASDERSAGYRAGVVRGPGTVLLRCPARLELRGRVLRLAGTDDTLLSEPQEVALSSGMRLEVAPCARR